jgi:transposase
MGNRKISPDLKECALRLWNVGWDIEDIHNALGISRASIYRWEAIFAEFGTVNRPPSPIRGQELRILTRALMTACEGLFAEESGIYLDELATWLALTHDISISISTLCRNLKEAGLTRKLLHRLAVERDEECRHEWKKSNGLH